MSAAPGIVILGPPRSGTTLLRRILDAHSSIACPPETYTLSAAARFLHEERFAHGLRIGVLVGLGYAGLPEADVLARLREFTFGLLADNAERQGKPRWAEKTAFDAFHVPAIRKLCEGHVKFVCLQRHGLDVACSIGDLTDKTGGYVEELHTYVRRYPQTLQAFAHAWVDTATAIADLADEDDNAIAVRYEDLVADPEAVAKRVFEHLGEPWENGLVERALQNSDQVGFGDWKTYGRSAIDASSVDRWKKLPQPALEPLGEICNPLLERLGYAPVRAIGVDDDEARRRYELGLMLGRMKAAKSDS
ncbi:MAG: sulfotransferase [Myxococcota bacterium]